ncbi:MAG: metallophosphoesterase family protein [Beduini sp.]|uniref:metallophosphoesterase family protein n=1 Tax=Beduini sp. TaxID=1922300 RepID=UPI00399084EC
MKHYRIAILSDIHANITAFKACIGEIEKQSIDLLVFLGDNVSDYPLPQETFDYIYELKKKYSCVFVKGNREDYLLNPKDTWKASSKNGSLYHTCKHLRPIDIEFMKTMPLTQRIELEGANPILIAHGSPENCYQGLYKDDPELSNWFEKFEEKLLIVGHTHTPFILKQEDRMIMNPGSVGSSVIGDNRAQYLLLEWNECEWVPTQKYIAYDYTLEQQRMIDSKYYEDCFYWAAAGFKNLETGVNEVLTLLLKAIEIAGNERPTEEDFAKAAQLLDISPLP